MRRLLDNREEGVGNMLEEEEISRCREQLHMRLANLYVCTLLHVQGDQSVCSFSRSQPALYYS